MKRLRPFVSFDFDLRNTLDKAAKTKITKYWNALSPGLSDKHVVYRPRRKDNIKRARDYTDLTLPGIKAFPINSPTGEGRVQWKPKGKKKRGKKDDREVQLVISKGDTFVRTIYPDQLRLLMDPRGYLNELLDNDHLYIVNSKNDWTGGGTKRAVIEKIESALFRYGWMDQDVAEFDEERLEAQTERRYGAEETEAGRTTYSSVYKDEFTIVIIEVSGGRDFFKSYVESRAAAQKGDNVKAGKERQRERSRQRRANKRRGYRPR